MRENGTLYLLPMSDHCRTRDLFRFLPKIPMRNNFFASVIFQAFRDAWLCLRDGYENESKLKFEHTFCFILLLWDTALALINWLSCFLTFHGASWTRTSASRIKHSRSQIYKHSATPRFSLRFLSGLVLYSCQRVRNTKFRKLCIYIRPRNKNVVN